MMVNSYEVKMSLEEARLLRKKRQKDMAEILSVSIGTYRKLERNSELLTIGQLKKITKFLNLPYYAFNFF